jgi:hypothetical protein
LVEALVFDSGGLIIPAVIERFGKAARSDIDGVFQSRSGGNEVMARNAKAKSSARSKPKGFKVGDHVSWNSEAGRVSGRIVRVHVRNVSRQGYVHHASAEAPQYEIKSDKTDHLALHKGGALRRLAR